MVDLFEQLTRKTTKLSVIGLGYVGLPLAIAFAKHFDVIGYDLDERKIELYKSGIDPTKEVGNDTVRDTTVDFTSNAARLREAKFHIVAVPTPVREDHTPDLSLVENACQILGENIIRGSVVVYESTVYPGVTEEVCAPILQKKSGLVCGDGFKIGYSPERINPGDKIHRLETIQKVVSGMDAETLELVAEVYGLVVKAGIYRAKSIKVAEAAKVIENSQRDINIAFMNELSLIFHKMDLDTQDVLKAAGTKWNFLPFQPGLVGGHCIGVDSYYLTHKAERMGYHSQVILAGRRINDDMGNYVADNAIKLLIKAGKQIPRVKVAILGFTFKENCSDIRNTRVIDIVHELRAYGIEPYIVDPIADMKAVKRLYGINLSDIADIRFVDAIILATAHMNFYDLGKNDLDGFFAPGQKVLLDVKGMFDKEVYEAAGYLYWRL